MGRGGDGVGVAPPIHEEEGAAEVLAAVRMEAVEDRVAGAVVPSAVPVGPAAPQVEGVGEAVGSRGEGLALWLPPTPVELPPLLLLAAAEGTGQEGVGERLAQADEVGVAPASREMVGRVLLLLPPPSAPTAGEALLEGLSAALGEAVPAAAAAAAPAEAVELGVPPPAHCQEGLADAVRVPASGEPVDPGSSGTPYSSTAPLPPPALAVAGPVLGLLLPLPLPLPAPLPVAVGSSADGLVLGLPPPPAAAAAPWEVGLPERDTGAPLPLGSSTVPVPLALGAAGEGLESRGGEGLGVGLAPPTGGEGVPVRLPGCRVGVLRGGLGLAERERGAEGAAVMVRVKAEEGWLLLLGLGVPAPLALARALQAAVAVPAASGCCSREALACGEGEASAEAPALLLPPPPEDSLARWLALRTPEPVVLLLAVPAAEAVAVGRLVAVPPPPGLPVGAALEAVGVGAGVADCCALPVAPPAAVPVAWPLALRRGVGVARAAGEALAPVAGEGVAAEGLAVAVALRAEEAVAPTPPMGLPVGPAAVAVPPPPASGSSEAVAGAAVGVAASGPLLELPPLLGLPAGEAVPEALAPAAPGEGVESEVALPPSPPTPPLLALLLPLTPALALLLLLAAWEAVGVGVGLRLALARALPVAEAVGRWEAEKEGEGEGVPDAAALPLPALPLLLEAAADGEGLSAAEEVGAVEGVAGEEGLPPACPGVPVGGVGEAVAAAGLLLEEAVREGSAGVALLLPAPLAEAHWDSPGVKVGGAVEVWEAEAGAEREGLAVPAPALALPGTPAVALALRALPLLLLLGAWGVPEALPESLKLGLPAAPVLLPAAEAVAGHPPLAVAGVD